MRSLTHTHSRHTLARRVTWDYKTGKTFAGPDLHHPTIMADAHGGKYGPEGLLAVEANFQRGLKITGVSK